MDGNPGEPTGDKSRRSFSMESEALFLLLDAWTLGNSFASLHRMKTQHRKEEAAVVRAAWVIRGPPAAVDSGPEPSPAPSKPESRSLHLVKGKG